MRRYAPLCSLSVAVIVFILHLFKAKFVRTDWITVALLVVIAFIPYISRMKTFSVGDVTMELRPEIEEAQSEIEESIPEGEDADSQRRTEQIYEEIISLADESVEAALIELRTEIESILRRILATQGIRPDGPQGAIQMFHLLEEEDTFEQDISESIQDVISLCNKAVHGFEVDKEDAVDIIELGFRVLDFLYSHYYEHAISPVKTTETSKEEVDDFRNSLYRLVTVVPTIREPRINERIVSQEALNDFLNGYNEFAEFIVEVERVEGKDE